MGHVTSLVFKKSLKGSHSFNIFILEPYFLRGSMRQYVQTLVVKPLTGYFPGESNFKQIMKRGLASELVSLPSEGP